MPQKINRRRFLKKTTALAAGTIAFPYFVPSSALGTSSSTAPSVMGCIGTGNQGQSWATFCNCQMQSCQLRLGDFVSLLLFLFQIVVISLSGVMAPGPVTAAAIATGSRNRYAGTFIALGHGIIEFPLMILIILGMGKILESTKPQIVIGLAGGTFLPIMAGQTLIGLKTN